MALPRVTGFNLCYLMSSQDVIALLGRIPLLHASNPPVQLIAYSDRLVYRTIGTDQPMNQVFGRCQFNQAAGTAQITIYQQHLNGNFDKFTMEHTILHEVGHSVFALVSTEGQRVEWLDVHQASGSRPMASGQNPVELFASSYAGFVLNPDFLHWALPEVYEYMEARVFPPT